MEHIKIWRGSTITKFHTIYIRYNQNSYPHPYKKKFIPYIYRYNKWVGVGFYTLYI